MEGRAAAAAGWGARAAWGWRSGATAWVAVRAGTRRGGAPPRQQRFAGAPAVVLQRTLFLKLACLPNLKAVALYCWHRTLSPNACIAWMHGYNEAQSVRGLKPF